MKGIVCHPFAQCGRPPIWGKISLVRKKERNGRLSRETFSEKMTSRMYLLLTVICRGVDGNLVVQYNRTFFILWMTWRKQARTTNREKPDEVEITISSRSTSLLKSTKNHVIRLRFGKTMKQTNMGIIWTLL